MTASAPAEMRLGRGRRHRRSARRRPARRVVEKAVVERVLGREAGGCGAVDANPGAETANVTYDPARYLAGTLRWVEECGYHCAGRSVPGHICDPMRERTTSRRPTRPPSAARRGRWHGHGGHAGMSMAAMARDMRNRFLVALPSRSRSSLWSPLGRDVLGVRPRRPVRHRRRRLAARCSACRWSSTRRGSSSAAPIYALRARTLDMMVLVAVAIGTGWIYSVAATFWIEGDVFYEAAALLAAFVLLGHWFEMRARGGANEAIRALLDLAPPMAVVLRDGEPVEVPTAEVQVGDLLLVRPGAKVPVDARGARGRERGRRVDGHRREPAGAEAAGRRR